MLANFGRFFADSFRRWLPDSFLFAILLTFIAAILAMLVKGSAPFEVVTSWYKGFWSLLTFAMQMVLILVTGFAIAISPPASRFIDWLASRIRNPVMVYVVVVFVGGIFALISWGWIVLTAVLARELATRVRGVDYRLVAACVYASFLTWHGGLSGSIPLLLNTPDNFLIKAGALTETIPSALTLGSVMNIVCNLALLVTLPLLMVLMRPAANAVVEFQAMREGVTTEREQTVAEEAATLNMKGWNFSDTINNSFIVQIIISLMAVWYLVWHFYTRGFDLNLNIINFLFIAIGMIAHKTPLRYVVALKRASANVSGIILQFPFYAGIMGIMIHTGLGSAIAGWIAGAATVATFPFVAFIAAGVVNLFVPSGGGEWAVVGSTIVEAARNLGVGMAPTELTSYIARASMAVAYGDAWTNMIQPFWTLAFFPIVAAGVRMQARDIMGYTFVAMLWSFVIFAIAVTWLPV
jgi:short-chain fatty acids transporter